MTDKQEKARRRVGERRVIRVRMDDLSCRIGGVLLSERIVSRED